MDDPRRPRPQAFLRHGFDVTSATGMLFANPWLIPVYAFQFPGEEIDGNHAMR